MVMKISSCIEEVWYYRQVLPEMSANSGKTRANLAPRAVLLSCLEVKQNGSFPVWNGDFRRLRGPMVCAGAVNIRLLLCRHLPSDCEKSRQQQKPVLTQPAMLFARSRLLLSTSFSQRTRRLGWLRPWSVPSNVKFAHAFSSDWLSGYFLLTPATCHVVWKVGGDRRNTKQMKHDSNKIFQRHRITPKRG